MANILSAVASHEGATDTRDKVQPGELDQALRIATTLAWQRWPPPMRRCRA
jgi:hypothetical protein